MSTLLNSTLYSNMVIFWGGGQEENQMIFKIQKKCLRPIKRVNKRVSCRGFFKVLLNIFGDSTSSLRYKGSLL
jgi:hypothetical protein